MPDALVIGIGNDLRRDDGVGRRVAAAIAALRFPGVRVRSVIQLVPELVDELDGADRVVFVDASLDVVDVVARPVEPAERAARSHHVGPAELLALARALGVGEPTASIVHLPVTDLSIGEGQSATGAASVETAVALVTDLLVGDVAVTQPGAEP